MTQQTVATHTPGPWEAFLRETVGDSASGRLERWAVGTTEPMDPNDPWAGRTFTGNVCDVRDWPSATAKANARLIAAVPALLEALEGALGEIESWTDGELDCHAAQQARATIALATPEGKESTK